MRLTKEQRKVICTLFAISNCGLDYELVWNQTNTKTLESLVSAAKSYYGEKEMKTVGLDIEVDGWVNDLRHSLADEELCRIHGNVVSLVRGGIPVGKNKAKKKTKIKKRLKKLKRRVVALEAGMLRIPGIVTKMLKGFDLIKDNDELNHLKEDEHVDV